MNREKQNKAMTNISEGIAKTMILFIVIVADNKMQALKR